MKLAHEMKILTIPKTIKLLKLLGIVYLVLISMNGGFQL
jgi:hypothetical protein